MTSPRDLEHLDHPLPFGTVDPAAAGPAADRVLARAEQAVERVASSSEAPTYENTLVALDEALAPLDTLVTFVGHLESVATTPDLRAVHEALQPKAAAFYAWIGSHGGLYRRVRRLAERLEGGLSAPPYALRHARKTRDAMARSGAGLSDAEKSELARLDAALAEATTAFARHVLDATSAHVCVVNDEARLAGLPDLHRKAARAEARARKAEGWAFTLAAPSYVPAMTYLEDRELRRTLWVAYHGRAASAPHDNRPLVREILRLRREKARRLGHATFAHLVLADRMARTPERARAFVEDLAERSRDAMRREHAELEAFAGHRLQPWDLAFWAQRLRKERYAFDEEDLRPYFPLPHVLDGLFGIARDLFGISVRPAGDAATWDESVSVHRVEDEDGTCLGDLHLDLFPRDTKRSGAWMNGLVTGCPPARPHVVALCGNLTPATDGTPPLLSHEEVATLFHEFGHGLHHLASRVPVRAIACTNVAWDFVEVPSQLLENWCWERAALDRFARHHATGAPMPDALFRKMRAARTFRAGTAMMRQLGFASTDLELHVSYDPLSDEDPFAFARPILSAHAPVPLPEEDQTLAGFLHLFADPVGYAGGYYSYKWAEVIEADCFERFAREGVLAPAVGRAFRRAILARGDTEDPAELVRSFLGRDPTPDALLRRCGLSAPTAEPTSPGCRSSAP